MNDPQLPGDEPLPHEPEHVPARDPEPPTYTAKRVDDPPPAPPPARRRAGVGAPLVLFLGAVVIGLAVLLLVYFPFPRGPQASAEANQLADLQNQVQALTAQVRQLEAQPAGNPAKLAALAQQVDALAHAPAPAQADLTPIEQRLGALEKQVAEAPKPSAPTPAVDLAPVQDRLSAVEKQVAELQAAAKQPPAGQSELASRVSGIAAAVAPLQGQLLKLTAIQQTFSESQQRFASEQQKLADEQRKLADGQQRLANQVAQAGNAETIKTLTARLDQQQSALDTLKGDVGKAAATAQQAARAARIQAALASLNAGRPLGTVPDAPAAVARFAHTAPPTMNDLRQRFSAVARQVLAASEPAKDQKFLDRLWTNAQDLVTVRQGDRVLVGDPAAGIVANAQDDLDRGDVQGAVDVLSRLNGPAAQAASGWVGSAKSLLEARAALLGMTGAA